MSKVEVDKVIPQSGTTLTIGDSGDTINLVGTLQSNGSPLPGDISSVVAGTGLSGGGTTGAVTLNIEAAQPTITSLGTITTFRSTGIDDNADATAITIDSSERVGLQYTTPSNLNASADDLVIGGGSGSKGLTIFTGAFDLGSIFFADGTSGGEQNRGSISYAHSGNSLRFGTSSIERMRIDGTGVGIGTSAPNRLLTLGGTSNAKLGLNASSFRNYTLGSDVYGFSIYDDTSTAYRLTVNASGNVGIGTTAPSQLLHLKSTTNEKPNLLIETENDGANGGRLDFLHKSSSPADGDLLGDITFGGYSDSGTPPSDFARYVMMKAFAEDVSNNAEKGRLTFSIHSGASNENNVDVLTLNGTKVGIGTTSPARQLTVSGSVSPVIAIVDTGTSGTPSLFFGDSSADNVGKIQYSNSDNSLATVVNGSERMRIDSSGRVMIGTTTADGILKVSDTNNETYLVVQNAKSGGSGEGVLSLKNDVGNWQVKVFTDDSFRIRDNTNGADRLTINTSGDVIAAEKILIGSATTSGKFAIATNAGSVSRMISLTDTGNAGGGRDYIEFFNVSGGSAGSIEHDGTSTVAYRTSSDYRLKENVNYDFDATTRLKQLKPARFNFITDADKTVDGFLAHEVSDIVPEAIGKEKDALQVWNDGEELPEGVAVGDNKLDADGNTIPDYQGIDQSKLVPLLVKTIQELEARITTLENA